MRPGPAGQNGLLAGFAQEANPSIQRAVALAKECQKGGRVHVVVYGGGVRAVGNVVNAKARSPAIAFEIEFAFHGDVQDEEVGELELSRRGNQFAELVYGEERKPAAPDRGISNVKLLELPEQWHRTPGLQQVGSVPGQGARLLAADDETAQGEVNGLVGTSVGAGIGDQEWIATLELLA